MIEITNAASLAGVESEHRAAPRIVGRYEVLRPLARADTASVWLARHLDLDREVALKEVSAFRFTDRAVVNRFVSEARRAGAVSHPNIVAAYNHFEADGTPYIAMEYMPNGSLRHYAGGLDLAQVVGVLEGVLGGLAHAEVKGVVHRALKPENIMVTAEGRVKIADFGIAAATQAVCTWADLRAPRQAAGAQAYMAPEQGGGQPVGPWTDLYSVGVIAHELLVGRPPLHQLDAHPAVLDPALARWVGDLLAADRHRRTSSAYVAWDSLEEIAIDLWGPRWRRGARITTDVAP